MNYSVTWRLQQKHPQVGPKLGDPPALTGLLSFCGHVGKLCNSSEPIRLSSMGRWGLISGNSQCWLPVSLE